MKAESFRSMSSDKLTLQQPSASAQYPHPASMLKGSLKKGVAKLKGISPNMFLDKLGERIAFERTGTRLYDELISKYRALLQAGSAELPRAQQVLGGAAVAGDGASAIAGGSAWTHSGASVPRS
jgi:hypothetical protein